MSEEGKMPTPAPPGPPPSTTLHPKSIVEENGIAQAAGAIGLAGWMLFSNVVLILSILRSESRRKVSFNLHVCNLSLVGVAISGFILPLYIDYCLRGEWGHSDQLCNAWLIADMLACTMSVLIVLMMIFDRFFLFSCPEAAEGGCKFVFSSLLIILPWALGCSMIIPLYNFGETGMGSQSMYGVCYLDLKKAFAITLPLAGYAVPALAAFGLLVATSLTWCTKKEELREMDYSEEREHKGWQVITSWVIVITVLGMWFPLPALQLLTHLIPRKFPIDWYTFALWMGYCNAGLNPILWMIMPRLRRSVVLFLCCCCGCCPCAKKCCTGRVRRYEASEKDDETGVAMIEYSNR